MYVCMYVWKSISALKCVCEYKCMEWELMW
jgi:hypothetical protein